MKFILALFVSILVEFQPDGSAVFTEKWDLDATEGTEWYLVKSNLSDISISNYSVSENGQEFINEGSWDIDRSIARKSGRCGIVAKRDGCELCWGLGSMGHHEFTVRYTMSNVVKSLNDYDLFHMQLVSPGLSTAPDKVSVRFLAPVDLTTDNSRVWGFGFNGNSGFQNNREIFLESGEKFSRNSSVIALLRFNKGIFDSPSVQDRDFQDALDIAMEGSSYESSDEEDIPFWAMFLGTLAGLLLAIWGATKLNEYYKKTILGCNEKDIDWCRDVPFQGELLQSSYVLDKLGRNGREKLASAMILRMIQRGNIIAGKDKRGNIELSFGSAQGLNGSELDLYNMMVKASGSDVILQKNEFRRWATRHYNSIAKWTDRVEKDAISTAGEQGNMKGTSFTPQGQAEARKVVGFKKFLKDFTLLEIRGTGEVGLWQDYLVFGALYGIADKVAKELKEINPELFDQAMNYDYNTTMQMILLSRMMAGDITCARTSQRSSAAGGFGGATSFGGGGGFSGGGFGGGAR